MARMTIKQAAQRLGVAEATVRRHIHLGKLAGVQMATPQGFTWLVELPDGGLTEDKDGELDRTHYRGRSEGEIQSLRDLIELLRYDLKVRDQELEARREEIRELHAMLQEAQSRLLQSS